MKIITPLFYIFLIASGCSTINYDDLLRKANEQYAHKDYLGAILDLSLLEQKNQTDSIYLLRAKCYQEIGKLDHAFRDLNEINKHSPLYPEASLMLGNIHIKSGDTIAALNLFEQISLGNGKSASEAFIELGRIAYFQNDNSQALNYFNRAVEKDSSYFLAYYFRGLIQSRFFNGKGIPTKEIRALLDFNAAERDYTQAIILNPQYAPSWFQRGVVHWNLFRDSAGLADVNKAIVLDPKDGSYLQGRSSYFASKGEFKKAIQDIDNAILLNPYDPQSFRDRAEINRKLNKDIRLIEEDLLTAERLQKKWDSLSNP